MGEAERVWSVFFAGAPPVAISLSPFLRGEGKGEGRCEPSKVGAAGGDHLPAGILSPWKGRGDNFAASHPAVSTTDSAERSAGPW